VNRPGPKRGKPEPLEKDPAKGLKGEGQGKGGKESCVWERNIKNGIAVLSGCAMSEKRKKKEWVRKSYGRGGEKERDRTEKRLTACVCPIGSLKKKPKRRRGFFWSVKKGGPPAGSKTMNKKRGKESSARADKTSFGKRSEHNKEEERKKSRFATTVIRLRKEKAYPLFESGGRVRYQSRRARGWESE